MMRTMWLAGAGLVTVLFGPWPCARAAEETPPAAEKQATTETTGQKADSAEKPRAEDKFILTEPIVIKMKEVPAFGREEVGGRTVIWYGAGQMARCTRQPNSQVKAYPKLVSQRPLYGSVSFGGIRQTVVPRSPLFPSSSPPASVESLESKDKDVVPETVFHFVLDEAGAGEPSEPGEKSPAQEERKSSELLRSLSAALLAGMGPGPEAPSVPPGSYNRLYFDLNGDLDLTNDPVMKLAEKPPFEGYSIDRRDTFEELQVSFDHGPPLGTRPVRVVPRLVVDRAGEGVLFFMPSVARRGTFRVGEKDYTAHLSQTGAISGRYDRPLVQVQIVPVDRPMMTPQQITGLVSGIQGYLGQILVVDGEFLTASASLLGDELTLRPYDGDYGVLEVGSGGRAITEMGLSGYFQSPMGLFPLGDPASLSRRYRVPVGEYLPSSLTIQYGRLRFSAQPLRDSSTGRPSAGALKIDKEKPVLIEFSGKPAVVFSNPPKDKTFKPGEQVPIRALLTEPATGMLITGLYDSTRKVGERQYFTGTRRITIPQFASLDPTIVVRNAQGEQVAEGKMPFG